MQAFRLSLRTFYTSHVYGLRLGAGVPLRALYGNFINCSASLGALWQYAQARYHRRPLVWLKTDHAYPGRDAVTPNPQNLGDLLVEGAYLPAATIQEIRQELQSDNFLAELLLARGLISDRSLCSALSLQSGVPFSHIDSDCVNSHVVRTLPRFIAARYEVVPFAVESGRLCVAGASVPATGMYEEIRRCTPLPVEFHLVTRRNYDELRTLL